MATVPDGSDDVQAWCSDLSGGILSLADVDDIDLRPEETVPEIMTLGTLPTEQAWSGAVNQLYNCCMSQVV